MRTLLLALGILCVPLTAQAELPADRAAGAATIDADQLREWLTTLSSEEFGGRETGHVGFAKAAAYVSAHFEQLGLKPLGDSGSFLQALPWTQTGPNYEKSRLVLRQDETGVVEITGRDELHGHGNAPARHAGELAIVVVDDAKADISKLDLESASGQRGIVVYCANNLVAKGSGWRQRSGTQQNVDRIARGVRRAGGRLLAIANGSLFDYYGPIPVTSSRSSARGGRAAAGRNVTPLQLVVSPKHIETLLGDAAEELALADGLDVKLVAKAGLHAELEFVVEKQQAPAYNVVAMLEGRDPELKDEYVAIGCHLDHLGRNRTTYFPGADDDGSGTVGLMAVAQAFAENAQPPRRSVVFAAFCGEEKGLLGSRFFVENPPLPLENMVAELQCDMIGRDADGDGRRPKDSTNLVFLIGLEKLSAELEELMLSLNRERARFEVSQQNVQNVFSRSDHFNFAKLGIPICFFFTGFHKDYHRSSDTVEKINFPKLTRIARFVYDAGFELAERDGRPRVDKGRWSKLRGRSRREPLAPVK